MNRSFQVSRANRANDSSEKVFVSQERASGFLDRLTSEKAGNFCEVWETSGEPLDYC